MNEEKEKKSEKFFFDEILHEVSSYSVNSSVCLVVSEKLEHLMRQQIKGHIMYLCA